MRREILHGTVNQVAGHRDQIRVESVYGIDDRIDVTTLDAGTDVDVADLCNGEPL